MTCIWFWKPCWYWHGLSTLVPFLYGHDEYARRTIMLGWTITGRVIIALWGCGSAECQQESARAIMIAKRAKQAAL